MDSFELSGRRGRRNMNLTRSGGGRIKAQGGDMIAAKAFSRKQAIFNEKAAQYAGTGSITTPGYLSCPLNTSYSAYQKKGVKSGWRSIR